MFSSVFAKLEKEKKGLLVSSFDLKTFFDSEDIFNILNEVYSSKVRGKLYRLIYHMNENVRIKVKTPVGITRSENIGPACTQGSVDGPVISSNSIGNGVTDAFKDAPLILYESIKISSQIFMDDILKSSEDVASAQIANKIMEDLTGKKSLQLNLDKISFLRPNI